MKILLIFSTLLLFASCAWGQSYEYLRPTTDTDTIWTASTCNVGTDNSVSMSATYSGKSGIGPITSSYGQLFTGENQHAQRVFSSWQSGAGGTYSILVLNITAMKLGTLPYVCAAYSTDGGGTWTNFCSIGTSQTTCTATITGTPLANIQVGVGSSVGAIAKSSFIRVFDIWTAGAIGASPGFDGGTFETGFLDSYGIWDYARRWRKL
jgi:hypothetical protein